MKEKIERLKTSESLTNGELYDPAMLITDQEEADEYLSALVDRYMRQRGVSKEEAEGVQRANIGYYSGYMSDETAIRAKKLFRCKHPVFDG